MAPKEKKTKAQIAAAASAGGKAKKKKWSKGKKQDRLNNAVTFDKTSYNKLMTEIPKMKVITPAVISERLHINGSLARLAIKHLAANNLITRVGRPDHTLMIYTRVVAEADE